MANAGEQDSAAGAAIALLEGYFRNNKAHASRYQRIVAEIMWLQFTKLGLLDRIGKGGARYSVHMDMIDEVNRQISTRETRLMEFREMARQEFDRLSPAEAREEGRWDELIEQVAARQRQAVQLQNQVLMNLDWQRKYRWAQLESQQRHQKFEGKFPSIFDTTEDVYAEYSAPYRAQLQHEEDAMWKKLATMFRAGDEIEGNAIASILPRFSDLAKEEKRLMTEFQDLLDQILIRVNKTAFLQSLNDCLANYLTSFEAISPGPVVVAAGFVDDQEAEVDFDDLHM